MRKLAPNLRKIRLFCTREANPGAAERLLHAVTDAHGKEFELDVWDGRRIAEYIVDVLLRDDTYVNRVGSALPNLRRISEQNAATGLVPAQCRAYGGREFEEIEIKRRLEASKCVVLSGLSGVGKTQVAVAVANALRDAYDMVMWITANEIESVQDLQSVDVRNNGYKHNVRGTLKLERVLLVLDDVVSDLDLGELVADCNDSRVIITSQTAFGADILKIDFVDREHARRILSSGLEFPCPEAVTNRAIALFGGHPLVLELLNRQAAADGDWLTVERDFEHLLGDTTKNRETAAKRLLARHQSAVGPELAFICWCGSSSVDAGLFRYRFGELGQRKLAERAMTVPAQDDVVKVHQLIFAALERLRVEEVLTLADLRFESDLVRYLTETGYPKGLPFFRVVHRHRSLLSGLLQKNPRPGAIRYAYFHGHSLAELRPDLIGTPECDASAILAGGCEAMAVLSLMEAIELDYRVVREVDHSAAKSTLERRLPLYDEVMDRADDSGIADIVRHHRAKSLLKLQRREDALAEFRRLLDSPEVRFQARLQVARESRDDPATALKLIVSIIEAERGDPGTVPTSVLLEAFAALRFRFLGDRAKVVERDNRTFMAQQIKAAACSGDSQPIRTFAAVGADWAFADEALFVDVMREIDVGTPEDAEDDGERVAIGRVLAAEGKRHMREDRERDGTVWLEDAVAFYCAIPTPRPFASTHHADALIQLGRADDARDVLEAVPKNARESYWRLRRSDVHRAKKENSEALACLDEALQDENLGGRRATFLESHGNVLFDMQDRAFRNSYIQAIEASDSEKNMERLARKLEALERDAARW